MLHLLTTGVVLELRAVAPASKCLTSPPNLCRQMWVPLLQLYRLVPHGGPRIYDFMPPKQGKNWHWPHIATFCCLFFRLWPVTRGKKNWTSKFVQGKNAFSVFPKKAGSAAKNVQQKTCELIKTCLCSSTEGSNWQCLWSCWEPGCLFCCYTLFYHMWATNLWLWCPLHSWAFWNTTVVTPLRRPCMDLHFRKY